MSTRLNKPLPQQLTPDERRVIQNCMQESFYYRVVPLSSALMAGVLYMVRTGRWRGGAKLGAIPKMAAAGIVGYIVGKVSYVNVCKMKLMALPDSPLGQALRNQGVRGGDGVLEYDVGEPVDVQPACDGGGLPPARADGGLDGGLDDYYRPTVDTPGQAGLVLSTDELQPAQSFTTYEELRRENRASVEARLRHAGTGHLESPASPPPPPPSQQQQQQQPLTSPGLKNKYGDVWDK